MTTDTLVISQLALAGHDSELFSFLDPAYVEQLTKHPAASRPLWTFGTVTDPGALRSVSTWNTSPGCFAFTRKPVVENRDGKFLNFRGFVTNDQVIAVEALILIRHLFVQGYTCGLDLRPWISTPADRALERLPYIRSYAGKSPESPEWQTLQCDYFDWALTALHAIGPY